jgi:hypothetical protein
MNRVKDFVKRRPLVSAIAAVIVLGVGAWLVFGFFGFQTLFIDEEVAEANPFVAEPGASGLAVDETTEEMADAMNEAMDDAGKSGDDVVSEPMAGSVTTLAEGSFIGRAHPTTGLAKVITDGNQRFLRFEGFKTDNGPDLNVYLATGPPDGSPEDFIDLGDLKGNIGDQNYELPDDIDLDRYTTVFIWCVRFSVAFGAAPLA